MKLNWPDGRVANFLLEHYVSAPPKHPCDSIRNLINKLQQRGCHVSKKSDSARIHLLVSWGKVSEAAKVAERAIATRNITRGMFESLALGYAKQRKWNEQIKILNSMTFNGYQPGDNSYLSILMKYFHLGMPIASVQCLHHIKSQNQDLSPVVVAQFIQTQESVHIAICILSAIFSEEKIIPIMNTKVCLEACILVSIRQRNYLLIEKLVTHSLQSSIIDSKVFFTPSVNGSIISFIFSSANRPADALKFFYSICPIARRDINASIVVNIFRHIIAVGRPTDYRLLVLTTAAEAVFINSKKKASEIESLMKLYRDSAQTTKAEQLLAYSKKNCKKVTMATYYSSLLSDIEA